MYVQPISMLAQGKSAGLITRRTLDRNQDMLCLSFFLRFLFSSSFFCYVAITFFLKRNYFQFYHVTWIYLKVHHFDRTRGGNAMTSESPSMIYLGTHLASYKFIRLV
ncbi:hypothetical protein VN97_g1392 [Penicillium thymicola]|uniref:Uncharacterized protein n=2 Tax=Penicillium thymicola TaxID=293382 RepID=A0AAI9TR33_PENTH|nr:hypothetical protein VN97_g1392 [Penicillium thymicola]